MNASNYHASDRDRFDQTNKQASIKIYRPVKPHQIRLLTIKPSSENTSEDVECTLKEVSLLSQPSYRALSYMWGSISGPGTIRINGELYLVTQSLFAALR
jgi:hypothetical protein